MDRLAFRLTGDSKPPAQQSETGKDADDDEIWIDDDPVEPRFMAWIPGPVGGRGEKERDIEEWGPIGKREQCGAAVNPTLGSLEGRQSSHVAVAATPAKRKSRMAE
jgi:hypothetical protein